MKKGVSLLLLCMGLFFSACGQAQKSIDIAELAADLRTNIDYTDEMTQASDGTIAKVYAIDFAVQQQVYLSSGATAEEVAVFALKDEKDAGRAYDKAKERLEQQKKDFENYMPAEMQKLEKAVVKKAGKYVVVCVANGDKAEAIIGKYLNG